MPQALLVPGAILRKAAPSTSCAAPPLEVNEAEPDWTLYEVGIETVHTASRAKGLGLVAIGGDMDFDGNGETDRFGICRTEDGVRLDIWSDRLGGERLWSALLRSSSKSESASCDPVELFYAPLGRFEAQVGYVHQCLAIKDPTLAPGTRVTIIAPQNGRYEIGQRSLTWRIQGTVRAKVDSDEHCPPLREAPRSENESEGVSFYEIALEQDGLMSANEAIFGIAILDSPVEKRIDLDSNGEDDSFTLCKSLEGLNYELWSGAPEEGEPLWRAYYYLFYDSAEWDCPGMFDDDISGSTSEPP